jgi:catechol 2,3-dioxygenase-like lactoylglutathione lyase family enzyme
MSAIYHFDHIHILSRDPEAAARYYQKMFDAKIIESIGPDGKPRIDVDLNGLILFIFRVAPEDNLPDSPPERYVGLDHFGLRVDNLDQTASELKSRGAVFSLEPTALRPGLRIAFLRAPENVRIELLERS